MAIAHLQEILFSLLKQQNALNNKLSANMMQTVSASRNYSEKQVKYNQKIQNYYYAYYDSDPNTYYEMVEAVENERELELGQLQSWEAQLNAEKDEIETQLSEINTYRDAYMKLLGHNCKKDFTYGSVS